VLVVDASRYARSTLSRGAFQVGRAAITGKCRSETFGTKILMAAYEELPGLVGQKFQTEYFSRKSI
jgi:hypothetical protein